MANRSVEEKQSEENIIKQEDHYYKPTRVSNFWNNNYIEHESSGDTNKNLSVNEYLDKLKPYLRDIMINLQKSDIRKTQLTLELTLF